MEYRKLEPPGPASPFLNLPLELRELIYEYTMAELPTEFAIWDCMVLSPLTLQSELLPGICFLNHQIHQEAMRTYIRRTRFTLHEERTVFMLEDFLQNSNAFCSLPNLALASPFGMDEWFNPYTEYEQISLMSLINRCPHLRRLTIHLERSRLVSMPDPSKYDFIVSKGASVRSVRVGTLEICSMLKGLSGIQELNLVTMRIVPFGELKTRDEVSVRRGLMDLEHWIKAYYKEEGKTIQINLYESCRRGH